MEPGQYNHKSPCEVSIFLVSQNRASDPCARSSYDSFLRGCEVRVVKRRVDGSEVRVSRSVCSNQIAITAASERESFFHLAKDDSGSVPTLWLLTVWEAESVTV